MKAVKRGKKREKQIENSSEYVEYQIDRERKKDFFCGTQKKRIKKKTFKWDLVKIRKKKES